LQNVSLQAWGRRGERITQSQAQWLTPEIPALRKLRKEGHKVKASLGYILRPCLKNKKR
jgi:hypothetical protein